jgi:integrase
MPSYKLRRFGPIKNWYAFYSVDRRSKSWSTGTPDKPLAIKRADAYFALLFAKNDASPDDLKVVDVLLRYQDDKREEFASATADFTIAKLMEYYGNSTVAEITAATNKDYELDRRKAGWANATINRTRNTLRAALKHAVKDGKLRYAPHVPTLKVAQTKERWLAYEEAVRLHRASLGQHHRHLNLFNRIGLGTGARHEAILSLTWDRVDLEQGRIDFRVPGRVETKKRRPNAPVSDRLIRLLRAAYKVREGDYVVMFRGKPLRSIKKAFAHACARACIAGVTPHTLKHTYITWALRSGVSIWDVAGLTNTSPDTIEKHYGHHAKDRLKLAANSVNSAELVPNGSGGKALQKPLNP